MVSAEKADNGDFVALADRLGKLAITPASCFIHYIIEPASSAHGSNNRCSFLEAWACSANLAQRHLVHAIVSGNFPGSPYAFDYKFLLRDDKIAELAIDPIGPVGQ